MKTIAIQMKNYAPNVNIINNNNFSSRLLNTLLLAFGILALSYVLILGNMVWNIVERRTFENEANVLSSRVGELELQYLSMSDKVDLVLALSMGFGEAKTKQFVNRKSIGRVSSSGEPLSNVKLAKNDL